VVTSTIVQADAASRHGLTQALDAMETSMTPQEELDAALVDYEQAEERVSLEHQNWSILQSSYDALMESLQQKGLSRHQAQEQFNAYMQSHAESFGHALDQRANASSRLSHFLRRFPHLMLSFAPKRSRRHGI